MKGEKKLTFEDFCQMFGGEIPIEAISLVWDAPAETKISDIRVKLYEMAERRRAMIEPLDGAK